MNNNICPESAAVFAQTPSFGLAPALASGHFKRPQWQALCAILRNIEHGKMPTHYLLRSITDDALGPQTPVGNASVEVEPDDREIGDTLDQQPVALLGLAQSFESLVTFTNLTRKLLVSVTQFCSRGHLYQPQHKRA